MRFAQGTRRVAVRIHEREPEDPQGEGMSLEDVTDVGEPGRPPGEWVLDIRVGIRLLSLALC